MNGPRISSPLPLLVAAAWLERADGAVLMQQRPPGKHHAGLWEFPGGKVEPGEGAVTALCRELAEELGILVQPDAVTPLHIVPCTGADGRALRLQLLRVSRWQGEPQSLEASALHWAEPARLRALPMPPGDRVLLDAQLSGLT